LWVLDNHLDVGRDHSRILALFRLWKTRQEIVVWLMQLLATQAFAALSLDIALVSHGIADGT
jgi:hypothetical protein